MALTFDDGPDPRGTPAVLDALAEAGVKATFFVLAERVEAHPELFARVRADGHDVQIHGYGHLRHPYTPREDVEDDIDRALTVVPGVTKWRIPWGHLATYTRELAARRKLQVVGWDADTHDWRGDSAEEMLARLEPRLEPGSIVLAHDGVGAGARRQHALETAKLIGPLVTHARARGLEPGPLREPWPVPIPLGNPNL